MLILTRRIGESIVVGEDSLISFTILGVNGLQVKIGVNAPKDIPVHRKEIAQKIENEKKNVIEFKSINDDEIFGIKVFNEIEPVLSNKKIY